MGFDASGRTIPLLCCAVEDCNADYAMFSTVVKVSYSVGEDGNFLWKFIVADCTIKTVMCTDSLISTIKKNETL
jgi:hypothetical protein